MDDGRGTPFGIRSTTTEGEETTTWPHGTDDGARMRYLHNVRLSPLTRRHTGLYRPRF